MHRTKFFPGLVLFLCLPSFAVTQSTDSPVPATTIHARSDLVVVDVTVLDTQQNPVHNLTAGDFKIYEDGRLQTVKNFEEHAAVTAPAPVAPMPKLEPGTYTNRAPVPASGPLNVLLIDFLNTPIHDRPFLRNHVLKFLKEMRPGTQLAIFVMNDHLYLLQGFTTDVDRLTASVLGFQKVAIDPQPSADNSQPNQVKPPAASTRVTEEVSRVNPQTPSERRISTVQAINQLARYLATLPDRKNLIWFSDSFPPTKAISSMLSIDPALADSSADASNLLGVGRVAVYPVDAAGLRSNQSITNSDSVTGPNIGFFIQLADLISSMKDLAERTGGKPFFNTNDLAGAAKQAVEAGANYYTLTYVPTKPPVGIHPERNIKVEVARKDVTLVYRNKYPVDNPHAQNQPLSPVSASSNPPAAAAPALSSAMRVAMIHGAPEPAQIVFQVTASAAAAVPSPASGSKAGNTAKVLHQRYNLRIVASANNISCPAAADGVRHCALQFLTNIYDSTGTLFGNLTIPAKFDIPPGHYDAVLRDGIEFKQQIGVPVDMQDCTVRIGILDQNSGRIGAVELPIAEAAKLTQVSETSP